MPDIARRFPENPLLVPCQVAPSNEKLQVICLLNPGVFEYDDKTWLLVRVAEGLAQREGFIAFSAIGALDEMEMIEAAINDPELVATDPRIVRYKGLDYLTTLSHLRLFYSTDGIHFTEPGNHSILLGSGKLERFGIEDCRVAKIDDTYYLTYTAVSDNGVGVGLRTTTDWKNFEPKGMIIPPHNKDCALFKERINGTYYALHRPSSKEIGGNYIWLASSPDGVHWGNHQCIIKSRPEYWDSERVGAGAAPVKTEKGWLAIYHGANKDHRYCLGAFLMDLDNPFKVLAQTIEPIMEPVAPYEQSGFFGHVVFTNGHVVKDDQLTIYYGASDEFVCGAHFSINEILNQLKYG